jgi:hypothetical protein
MKVFLGGHLAYYQAERQPWTEIAIGQPLLLAEAARRMNIPEAEVALWVVNGEAVLPHETLIGDTDVVKLYPPVDGG